MPGVADQYDNDVTRIWTDATDGRDLLRRVGALPGFGKQKAQIFVALLGKQYGVDRAGLARGGRRLRAGGHVQVRRRHPRRRSLARVRDYKKQLKAAAKARRLNAAGPAGPRPGQGRDKAPRPVHAGG